MTQKHLLVLDVTPTSFSRRELRADQSSRCPTTRCSSPRSWWSMSSSLAILFLAACNAAVQAALATLLLAAGTAKDCRLQVSTLFQAACSAGAQSTDALMPHRAAECIA